MEGKLGRNYVTIDWEKVREWAHEGLTGLQIAARLGIHFNTFYQRIKEDTGQSWTDLKAFVRQERGEQAENMLMKLVQKGDVAATIFACKAYGGLSDRQTVEHVGAQPLEIRIIGAEGADED